MRAHVRRFADVDELSRITAGELQTIAHAAIAARGSFHLALSGGSTPRRLFEELAAHGASFLPWEATHLWWSDERHVPPEHPDSNYRMAKLAMIEPLGLDPVRVHRVAAELDAGEAARAYAQEMRDLLGEPPTFDVVLLGLGPDGHTASLFPHTPALHDLTHAFVANPVDSPVAHGKTTRLTMTAAAINAARHVRVLVCGADKAAILARVLEGPRTPDDLPAQLIRGADVAWLVDDAAAQQLKGLA